MELDRGLYTNMCGDKGLYMCFSIDLFFFSKQKTLGKKGRRVFGDCFAYDIALPHQYMLTNRNNQTTSTKCQYHAAASKPK